MTATRPELPAPLPRLLLLTDRRSLPPGRTLLATVEAAVRAGARAVIVRERDLPVDERASLVDACDTLLHTVGGVCLVADPNPRAADSRRSDGVHLRASSPLPHTRPAVLGRSTHDAGEVARAAQDGLDYVTLSPVAASPSKPGYGPPLGPAGLSALLRHARRECDAALPPVFALGGVEPGSCGELLAAGAYGVAVMGAVMRAPEPAAATAALLAALGSPPQAGLDRSPRPGLGSPR